MHANHLISTLAAFVFVPSIFGENIPTAEFEMIAAETACWDTEIKYKIFNEDCYLLLLLSPMLCTNTRERLRENPPRGILHQKNLLKLHFRSIMRDIILQISVADPCHFGTDLDPDPQIRTSD